MPGIESSQPPYHTRRIRTPSGGFVIQRTIDVAQVFENVSPVLTPEKITRTTNGLPVFRPIRPDAAQK